MSENEPDSPILAPPGAGIPWLERTVLTGGVRLYASRASQEAAMALFQRDAAEVLSMAESVSEEIGRKPVLVPRLRAMEDSSRFWSPYMIVQHLDIIDRGVLMLARCLAAGKSSDKVTGTADVKPSPDAGPEVTGKFRETVEAWRNKLATIPDLKTRLRHPHPWFGPLDAHTWVCVAALHHGVHLKQMRLVLRGARKS